MKEKVISDEEILTLARNEKVDYYTIMIWLEQAKDFRERVQINKLMGERIKVCIEKGKVF